MIVAATITLERKWAFPYANVAIIRLAVTFLVVSVVAVILELVRLDYHNRMTAEQINRFV